MNNAGKFYVVPKELYCYRLHEAYDWKDDLCQDALKGLLDELKYTSENNLDMCHYYAFQRCSYEFGDLLKKYAEQGDWQLIELFRLQGEVRNDLIESALKKNINLNIINPMLYTNNEVKYKDILGVKTYLITPLYDLIADREHINYKGEYMSIKKDYEQLENENNGIKKEYEQLENENKRIKKEYEQLENENKYNKEEYENIANSKTYKVGQKVVWLPKKILKFLHIRK
jgi:hypothetical protein